MISLPTSSIYLTIPDHAAIAAARATAKAEADETFRRWARSVYRQQRRLIAGLLSSQSQAAVRKPLVIPRTLDDLLRPELDRQAHGTKYVHVHRARRHGRHVPGYDVVIHGKTCKANVRLGWFGTEDEAGLAILAAMRKEHPLCP